jgi:archaellum component FlaC
MKTTFNKLILAVLIAALAFTAIPVTGAFAQGENPPKGGITNEKLEQVWARMSKMYERLGKAFDGGDDRLAKLQERIDKAKADGKDVTAVQTALDNFEAALKKAKPVYESMKGIFNSHQGFDANGKVTDAEKAKATLKDLRDKFKDLKSAMGGTGKALREALQAFREANKPAQKP